MNENANFSENLKVFSRVTAHTSPTILYGKKSKMSNLNESDRFGYFRPLFTRQNIDARTVLDCDSIRSEIFEKITESKRNFHACAILILSK